jgi:hypothetical protein
MRQYLYVIVRSDGTTLPLDEAQKEKDLALLFQEGWQPLRETPMSGNAGEHAWSLILLAKGGFLD